MGVLQAVRAACQPATAMAANVMPAPAIPNQLKYSDAIYLKVLLFFIFVLARFFTSVSSLSHVCLRVHNGVLSVRMCTPAGYD